MKNWLNKYKDGGEVQQPKILQDFERFRNSPEGKFQFENMERNRIAKKSSGRIDYSEIDPITDVLLGVGIGKGLIENISKKSPMWYDKFHLGNLKNEIPSGGGELIERGVSTEKAIQDFFDTGVIRNNKSAGILTKNDKRFEERVFWGPENKGNIPRNNFTIIAKNNPELLNRPVIYDDVQDILIKNQEGYSSYPNWKNNIKKPKLENGGEINYNDSSISFPKDYVGDGYNTKGRNYNPSWNGSFEDGGRTTSGKVRDFIHKTIGIPLSINQLGYDISSGQSPITEESLTDNELQKLREITRRNLSKGKSSIGYEDYVNIFNKEGDIDPAAKLSLEAYKGNIKAMIKSLSDPSFNLEYILGQSKINVTDKDTTVVDRYNFNQRLKPIDYLKDVFTGELNPYQVVESFGHTFGSKEGEGSPVNIKINQKKNGGELKKIDQLTNFNTFGESKMNWLEQYK